MTDPGEMKWSMANQIAARERRAKMRSKKMLMLISLLVAIALWMFVMGNVDPQISERVSGVSVEMEGTDTLEDQDLTATVNKPKVVNITIEGKRSQVIKAKKKGIKAYIDVSTCDYGKNEAEIYVRIPDGVSGLTVEDISSETAVFTVR
jgi:YbbR domain-containing protein